MTKDWIDEEFFDKGWVQEVFTSSSYVKTIEQGSAKIKLICEPLDISSGSYSWRSVDVDTDKELWDGEGESFIGAMRRANEWVEKYLIDPDSVMTNDKYFKRLKERKNESRVDS